MTTWSRVTLVGEQRRVDAVLPAQEPIGALMPEVLELLGDPVENPARLRHLTTAAGVILDGDTTLADRSIPDGAVLRLVRADDPLPAPVVHEVPESVGDALDDQAGRWNPAAARWTATGAVTALCLAIGGLVWDGTGGGAGAAAVAAAAGLLLVVGTVVGATWREPLGTGLAIAGGALGGLALWSAVDLYGWPDWVRWGGLAVVAGLLVVALGLTSLGRGGLTGGGIALLLALVWSASAALGLAAAHIAAVMAVVCVVLLSLLLRTALTLSGLTVLDDRRSAGSEVGRADVMSALAGAHRSMVVATVAVAAAAAAAGLGLASDFNGWTAALSVLLAIVVASRSRMFPLVAQKTGLLAAAVVILVSFAFSWAGQAAWAVWAAAGVLLGSLVIPVVVLATEQPEYVRARLRRIASRIEAVAVVALVPVAIGVFGTFQRLLDTF
ncbi:type VII secretion integral membrane protein EccD [Actinorugispora endophytica]|uniref:Type VII secretion integral membrane protein EccD n=1 Tax=Actinorugispora endophytica TaxID=1605990 RepID=A0A4R6V7J1_9ACTN|nr:type VII secretion integral membrane protein EccD [Actinorugispora endophytica]TDQ52263.1 type VII secretion integral membrane protein EccD [Actinorugispora endophytica]